MRVVLDTNVIVSGLFTIHGTCARIIDRLLAGDFQACVDSRIASEYAEVISRPKFRILPDIQRDFLEFIRYHADHIDAAPVAAKLPDKSDLPFLEMALAANAVLVTGNSRHFPKRSCKGVTITSPREFLDALAID